ncbi:MAG TPA: CocE/NonD family hydrolase, partial [Pseudonocardiaceae bacterium]|nr:CocE/NonD family hydrolase [Pseudonocardiaceae bacterium]
MGFADWAVDRLLHLPPPTTRHYDVEYGLRIPLPDGIVLLADRYRPVRTGPQPVVLVRTPYGRDFLTGRVFGAALARRGFQTVLQSVRGTSGSGGQFRGQHQERDDGVATVAWLRAQPWCDGRIAMVGGSYPGYAQWAVAPYVEPPLAAICPGVTTSGVEDQCGDVFALRGTLSWVARLDRQASLRLGGLLPDRRHAERMARAMTHLPMRTADVVAVGHELPLWRELLANVADVGHWAPADHSAALGRVRTPVSMVTGWYDHHLPWQLRDFRAIGDTGVPARITIGPWGHGDLATTAAMASDQLSWLATHLDGVPTETRAPVRVFLQHADRWLDLPAWPPESVPTPLYFAAGGRLTWTAPPAGAPAQ